MPDLNERLRGVDRVPAPDLWEHARGLAEEGPTDRAAESHPRRLLVAVVALAIAGAGFVGVYVAFNGGAPAGRPPVPFNGVIATLARGESGGIGVENQDIVAIDPSSGRRVDLTPGPDAENSPVWSPDGTRVAFLRTGASSQGAHVSIREGLFVMDADGSGLREVYPCASAQQCEVRAFAWSPDDRHLAWTLERGNNEGGGVLQILDIASGTTTDVCAHSKCGQFLGELAWSPDSAKLAFTDGAGVTPGLGGPLASSIWLVDADGGNLTRLTKGRACYEVHSITNPVCFADTEPLWSPDGRTLAFMHQSTGGGDFGDRAGPMDLVQMSPDGTDRRRETLCRDASRCEPSPPTWSPDGDAILFGTGYGGSAQLHLLDPSSGVMTDLRTQGAAGCVGAVQPSWSPDGKQVAFIGGPGRTANLCVVSADGGASKVLIPNLPGYALVNGTGFTWLPAGSIDMSPAPTPNSTTTRAVATPLPRGIIVFTSSNGSNQEENGIEIWSMASDGSHAHPLTSTGVSSPALSPDGTKVAYLGRGGVWVMDSDGTDPHLIVRPPKNTGALAWSPTEHRSPSGRRTTEKAACT